MGGREVGLDQVTDQGIGTKRQLQPWVRRGVDHACSLPAKWGSEPACAAREQACPETPHLSSSALGWPVQPQKRAATMISTVISCCSRPGRAPTSDRRCPWTSGRQEGPPKSSPCGSAWYRDHDVEFHPGTEVDGIDRAANTVTLPDGRRWATTNCCWPPARVRHLDLPGRGRPCLSFALSLADAEAIVRRAERSTHRWPSSGAADRTPGGRHRTRPRCAGVTVVDAELPLLAALGPEMAAVFADLHREHRGRPTAEHRCHRGSPPTGSAPSASRWRIPTSPPMPCWWPVGRSPTSRSPRRPGSRWPGRRGGERASLRTSDPTLRRRRHRCRGTSVAGR